MSVPAVRVRTLVDTPPAAAGKYILYWMVANRRPAYNFALDHAVDAARSQGRPLVIVEPLRVGYRWASDRHHRFIIDGMEDNARAFADKDVTYLPYIERAPGEGRGLFEAMAKEAAQVVIDDYPCFFLPRLIEATSRVCPVRYEAVDSNGLLPMHATEHLFSRAFDYRRYVQKNLEHVLSRPRAFLTGELPALDTKLPKKWRFGTDVNLSKLPIDHSVPPVEARGGATSARQTLERFLETRFDIYADERNHPDANAQSGLSFWLHFGHISPHRIFHTLARREDWTLDRANPEAKGQRGFWGMSEPAEAFLEELVTWRELGFNRCANDPRYAEYETLPDWAKKTLAQHEDDPRSYVYDLETLEQSRTHDPLWNAANNQLVQEGRVHNYLRMLWGKKILEWTPSPKDALEVMIHLNNKYAVDGRDPNSYSGIFWVLGRFDRAWGPERPIYGKVRYMTSDSARRKLRLSAYVSRYGQRSD